MRYCVLFMISCLYLQITSTAQTRTIEQLKDRYAAAPVSQKSAAALAVCSQYYSLNNDTLYHYAWLAKSMAVDGDRQQQVMGNVYVENYLTRKNLFDSSLHICNAMLALLNDAYNKRTYVQTMMQECFCLTKANRNTEALNLCYRFLAEAEKNNDTATQVFAQCNIGLIYRNIQQTELAMNWFQKADATAGNAGYEKIKNEDGVYFLLGMMYNWRMDGDNLPKEKQRDSLLAITSLDRAIADSRQYENLFILARALNVKAATVGNVSNVELEGRYVKEATHIYEALNDTGSMLNSISPMCFYYIDKGQPEKGIEACKQGIQIALHNNSYPALDLYEALGQCYYAAGNYPAYAETLSTIVKMKDSVYKVNSEQALAGFNASYEAQKRENIIIQQKLDITSKKYFLLLISIATCLLAIGIFMLYRYFTRKQKKMKQLEEAAIARAREAERKRISADLHDNIGAYAAAAAYNITYIKAKDEQSTDRLGLLKNNIQDMLSHLNTSIWALNKREVLLTNISDRFKNFIQKLSPAYPHISMEVHEHIDTDYNLSSLQALHVFRMMQEALNNAVRHSQCSAVCTTIQNEKGNITITIADNGKGISEENINGHGINNLKMRAAELGWKAQWISNDEGTSLILASV